MKPLPHEYDVALAGGPSGYAEASTPGVAPLRTAPPADYDGPGDAWSPEHLLLASIETCFLFTLRAVARVSKVEFSSLEMRAVGTVTRQDGVTRFSDIVLRPRLTVARDTNRDAVLQVLERSKKACLVSASLSTPIRLEPEVNEV